MHARQNTIAIISDSRFFRDVLSDMLRRAHFSALAAIPRVQIPSQCLAGAQVVLSYLDLHRFDRLRASRAAAEIIADIRSAWPGSTIVALGSRTELAAQASSADVALDLSLVGPSLLLQIAHAVHKRLPHLLLSLGNPPTAAIPWPTICRRERQVLDLLSLGSDNLKIAALLGVSERTVKAYVSSLLRKLEAQNRTELAVIARDAGFGSGAVDMPFRTIEGPS